MDLRKEFDDNVIWQWANNCPTCAGALVAAGRGDDSALGILQSGQSNNQHVQDVYRDAFNLWGAEVLWARVARLVDPRTIADFADLKKNTDWQYNNNLDSLVGAYQAWKAADGRWQSEILGLGCLLEGQRHDSAVASEYRACYDADRSRVHRIVASYFPKP
ncbi:hypothetical protein [Burkholderia contaminans]|uniref:hypothetical protein n=1 Tax=Burkholderia contaminans TaxID=488447 RepID=UPI003D66CA53